MSLTKVEPGSFDERAGAVGLIVAPVVFIIGWAATGRATEGYSVVRDAISEIAADGADQHLVMSGVFVVYGLWILVAVPAVRRTLLRPIWPALVVNALATMAVAAVPLHRSDRIDTAHGVAAVVGYVSLAASVLVGAYALGRDDRHQVAALASIVVGVGIGVALALTAVVDSVGLVQRVGLTLGDLWLMAAGAAILAGRLAVDPGPEPGGEAPESDATGDADL